jgi:hypothetical protein
MMMTDAGGATIEKGKHYNTFSKPAKDRGKKDEN